MWHIGLDVGAKESSYCALDENGRQVRVRRVRGPWDKVLSELAEIQEPFEICFEASTAAGWLWDHLQGAGRTVLVAHPGKVRMIFRAKTPA